MIGRQVCVAQLSITILASARLWKISPFKSSSRSFALKLSQQPFSQGDPGSM